MDEWITPKGPARPPIDWYSHPASTARALSTDDLDCEKENHIFGFAGVKGKRDSAGRVRRKAQPGTRMDRKERWKQEERKGSKNICGDKNLVN